MKKNWEIFINSGLVVYLRVLTLIQIPFQKKSIAIFLFCLIFGVFMPNKIFGMIFGGVGPGLVSRSLAGDFSFLFSKERPEVDDLTFMNFAMEFEKLEKSAMEDESSEYWTRAELDGNFKKSFSVQKSSPPIEGINCASEGKLMDLTSLNKVKSQKFIGCKKADDLYYYAGLLNAGSSENKDIRYFFYVVRKQVTAETKDNFWGKDYEWITYALDIPNRRVNFYKGNAIPSVRVVDIAFAIQESFPEGFKVEK